MSPYSDDNVQQSLCLPLYYLSFCVHTNILLNIDSHSDIGNIKLYFLLDFNH